MKEKSDLQTFSLGELEFFTLFVVALLWFLLSRHLFLGVFVTPLGPQLLITFFCPYNLSQGTE
jgi:hypothetical protein